MAESETPIDAIQSKICRLCLNEQPNMIRLMYTSNENAAFLKLLKHCFDIEIDMHEELLPLSICQDCVKHTFQFYLLKKAYKRNQQYLLNEYLSYAKGMLEVNKSGSDSNGFEPSDICESNDNCESSENYESNNSCEPNEADNRDDRNDPSTSEHHYQLMSSSSSSVSLITNCGQACEDIPNEQTTLLICKFCDAILDTPDEWKAHVIAHFYNTPEQSLSLNSFGYVSR